jgi:predicted kinase
MAQLNINLPELSLVVLIGASGSASRRSRAGTSNPRKSSHPTSCRGLVSDDENNQAATEDAFDVLHYIASKRLKNGLLTVVDATNLRPEDRRQYVRLAREYHCLPVAIVLNLPEKLCQERNRERPDRNFGHHVIRNQRMALRRASDAAASRCDAKASGTCGCSNRRTRSTRWPFSARRCGTTAVTNTARSTSSAMCTAASMNWSNCSMRSTT